MKPLTYDILISFSCSTIISFFFDSTDNSIYKKFNLVDKPDEREVHIIPIARLAGIAIFFASLFGVLFSNYGRAAISDLPIYFSAVAGMFLLGIWDDLKHQRKTSLLASNWYFSFNSILWYKINIFARNSWHPRAVHFLAIPR